MFKYKFKIVKYQDHTKASEKNVLVDFFYDKKIIQKLIPYYYRRTSLFLEIKKDIENYLEKIHPLLNPENDKTWEENQKKFWSEKKNALVTIPVFESLLGSKFTCNICSMPSNTNLQRRVQDIKEFGYTISTTNLDCKKCKKKTTHHQLIYLERSGDGKNEYETINPKLKQRIIKLLKNYDAFEDNYHSKGLLPDHKFPEIRWDKSTKEDNLNLTDEEIKNKFQLLTNQRNLQKREVCRKCFQSNLRGKIFGINFFYKGNEKWEFKEKVSKSAEKGCEGCGWYDISEWRNSLNKKSF